MIQQVNGSSVSQTTLNGLLPETTYNITVRAYQDILGPASDTVLFQTKGGSVHFFHFQYLNSKFLLIDMIATSSSVTFLLGKVIFDIELSYFECMVHGNGENINNYFSITMCKQCDC